MTNSKGGIKARYRSLTGRFEGAKDTVERKGFVSSTVGTGQLLDGFMYLCGPSRAT